MFAVTLYATRVQGFAEAGGQVPGFLVPKYDDLTDEGQMKITMKKHPDYHDCYAAHHLHCSLQDSAGQMLLKLLTHQH